MKILNINKVHLSDIQRRNGNSAYIVADSPDEILEVDSFTPNNKRHNKYYVFSGFAKIVGTINGIERLVIDNVKDTSELFVKHCSNVTFKNSEVHEQQIENCCFHNFINATYAKDTIVLRTKHAGGLKLEGNYPKEFVLICDNFNGTLTSDFSSAADGGPLLTILQKPNKDNVGSAIVNIYASSKWHGQVDYIIGRVNLHGFIKTLKCASLMIGHKGKINTLITEKIVAPFNHAGNIAEFDLAGIKKLVPAPLSNEMVTLHCNPSENLKVEKYSLNNPNKLDVAFEPTLAEAIKNAEEIVYSPTDKTVDMIDCAGRLIQFRDIRVPEERGCYNSYVVTNYRTGSGRAESLVILDSPQFETLPTVRNLWLERSSQAKDVTLDMPRLSELILKDSKINVSANHLYGVTCVNECTLKIVVKHVSYLSISEGKNKITGKIDKLGTLILAGNDYKGLDKLIGDVKNIDLHNASDETFLAIRKMFPEALVTAGKRHFTSATPTDMDYTKSHMYSPHRLIYKDGDVESVSGFADF